MSWPGSTDEELCSLAANFRPLRSPLFGLSLKVALFFPGLLWATPAGAYLFIWKARLSGMGSLRRHSLSQQPGRMAGTQCLLRASLLLCQHHNRSHSASSQPKPKSDKVYSAGAQLWGRINILKALTILSPLPAIFSWPLHPMVILPSLDPIITVKPCHQRN